MCWGAAAVGPIAHPANLHAPVCQRPRRSEACAASLKAQLSELPASDGNTTYDRAMLDQTMTACGTATQAAVASSIAAGTNVGNALASTTTKPPTTQYEQLGAGSFASSSARAVGSRCRRVRTGAVRKARPAAFPDHVLQLLRHAAGSVARPSGYTAAPRRVRARVALGRRPLPKFNEEEPDTAETDVGCEP